MRKINGKPKSNEPTSCQLSSQCVYPIVNACSKAALLRSKIDSIFCGRTRKKPKKRRRRRRSIAENFSAAVAIVASIAVAQT